MFILVCLALLTVHCSSGQLQFRKVHQLKSGDVVSKTEFRSTTACALLCVSSCKFFSVSKSWCFLLGQSAKLLDSTQFTEIYKVINFPTPPPPTTTTTTTTTTTATATTTTPRPTTPLVCDIYHTGTSCTEIRNAEDVLDNWCTTNTPGAYARFGWKVDAVVNEWRCYELSAVTADTRFWTEPSTYLYTRSYLDTVLDAHPNVMGKNFVGQPDESCDSACGALGKTCNPSIETAGSTYSFNKQLSMNCTFDITSDGDSFWKEEAHPYYDTVENKCYGFIAPRRTSCTIKPNSTNIRLLCRCD